MKKQYQHSASCCIVLTMMPTDGLRGGWRLPRASETGGLYEHHRAYGADRQRASDTIAKNEEPRRPVPLPQYTLYAALRCQRRRRRAAKSE